MAPKVDLRRVLLLGVEIWFAPSTSGHLGCWGSQPKHVSNPDLVIKKCFAPLYLQAENAAKEEKQRIIEEMTDELNRVKAEKERIVAERDAAKTDTNAAASGTAQPGAGSGAAAKNRDALAAKAGQGDVVIVQTKITQRWPLNGEPECVMCGRFAPYESSETGDGVCSMECKLNQIDRKQKGDIAVSQVPSAPLAEHPLDAKIPKAYSCEGALCNRGSVTAVTMSTSQNSRKRVLAAGMALAIWDITDAPYPSQPAHTVSPLAGVYIRAFKTFDEHRIIVSGTPSLPPPPTHTHTHAHYCAV